jgi:mRNA-degrading endonuclease HigB of HigAB toxin-antitoxin module
MRIIAKRILFEQAARYADSVEAINNWYRRVHKASWRSLADVRADYPHADLVRPNGCYKIP